MNKNSRNSITENREIMLLAEVDTHCCLCGRFLLEIKNGRTMKLYEIAHIYPLNPNQEQKKVLSNVPKPKNIDGYENLIPLCRDCHAREDFYTTVEDYMKLYGIKQKVMNQSKAMEEALKIPIEEEIENILKETANLKNEDFIELSLSPVALKQKINNDNIALQYKVKDMVVQYCLCIQGLFGRLEETHKVRFDTIAVEIRLCFIKFALQNFSQEEIFDNIVNWLKRKTCGQYNTSSYEIIVSFFIQNCEVFNEIAL